MNQPTELDRLRDGFKEAGSSAQKMSLGPFSPNFHTPPPWCSRGRLATWQHQHLCCPLCHWMRKFISLVAKLRWYSRKIRKGSPFSNKSPKFVSDLAKIIIGTYIQHSKKEHNNTIENYIVENVNFYSQKLRIQKHYYVLIGVKQLFVLLSEKTKYDSIKAYLCQQSNHKHLHLSGENGNSKLFLL